MADDTQRAARNAVDAVALTGGVTLIHVMGAQPGPTMALLGGVHGDEDEGVLAVGRVLHELAQVPITGSLRAVAQAHPQAWATAARESPLDGGNLARSFPGDPGGDPMGDGGMDRHVVGQRGWPWPPTERAPGCRGSCAWAPQHQSRSADLWCRTRLTWSRSRASAWARPVPVTRACWSWCAPPPCVTGCISASPPTPSTPTACAASTRSPTSSSNRHRARHTSTCGLAAAGSWRRSRVASPTARCRWRRSPASPRAAHRSSPSSTARSSCRRSSAAPARSRRCSCRRPPDGLLAAAAVTESGGCGTAITDAAILATQRRLATAEGILVEPAAAGLAALAADVEAGRVGPGDHPVLILSGAGWKDLGRFAADADRLATASIDELDGRIDTWVTDLGAVDER